MNSTLFKLKSFPSESLLFPSRDGQLENIVFAKSLDPHNPVINLKLNLAKQAREKNAHILPTSLLEEKSCNPFLRTHDPAIQKIVGERNPADVLRKLKLTQNMFFTTASSEQNIKIN